MIIRNMWNDEQMNVSHWDIHTRMIHRWRGIKVLEVDGKPWKVFAVCHQTLTAVSSYHHITSHCYMYIAHVLWWRCVGYARRRRRDIATARQRLHHLQQYHMKGNPVGNGSVSGAVVEQPPAGEHPSAGARQCSPAASQQSTLTTTSYVVAHNLPPEGATLSGHDRQLEDGYSISQLERRSHINGDVFYLSGRANTARCTTAHNDLADHTVTTFKYYTYDRDYFRERHKSSCLRDCNLRHSMEWTSAQAFVLSSL